MNGAARDEEHLSGLLLLPLVPSSPPPGLMPHCAGAGAPADCEQTS